MAVGTGSTGQAAFAGGGLRSVAAQLPLSRATGPTAQGAACPARRTTAQGAALFLVVAVAAFAGSHCWRLLREALPPCNISTLQIL